MEKTNSTTQKDDKRVNEIIRVQKKQHNFVLLDKGFIDDERLSFKAKGILTYLLSKHDNWKVIVKDLINHSADGAKSVYTGLRELKKYGYYKKVPVRDVTNSVISHWESIVYECPQDEQISKNPQPSIKNDPKSSISPLLADFVHVDNVHVQNEYIQNVQRNNIYQNKIDEDNNINNNKNKKDLHNLNVSIYQSEIEKPTPENITAAPPQIDEIDTQAVNKIFTTEEVAEKICLDELHEKYADKQEELNLINDYMCEILAAENTAKPPCRIAKQPIPFVAVKNRFAQLEKAHIEYVIDSLNNNGNKYKINKNTKSYIMTSLFNSLRTITHYYKRDFKKQQTDNSKFSDCSPAFKLMWGLS